MGEDGERDSQELNFAIRTAREAGRQVMELANASIKIRQKTQLKGDVVTNADMASDAYIINAIRQQFPEDAILTEESVDDRSRLTNKRVWIIDPIDGTKNYSDYALSGCTDKKAQYFAVHIGLAVDGAPVVGVVFAPAIGELFYASKGDGAYVIIEDEKPRALKVDRMGAEKHDVVLAKYLYDMPEMKRITANFPLVERPYGVVYGYYLASIALRRLDAYVIASRLFSLSEWDACAPHLILEEAGGFVSDLKGRTLAYNKREPIFKDGVIASAREGIIPFLD